MDIERGITDGVQERQLIWFGHTNGIDETRWRAKY
jgi:hypothetical protein